MFRKLFWFLFKKHIKNEVQYHTNKKIRETVKEKTGVELHRTIDEKLRETHRME